MAEAERESELRKEGLGSGGLCGAEAELKKEGKSGMARCPALRG